MILSADKTVKLSAQFISQVRDPLEEFTSFDRVAFDLK